MTATLRLRRSALVLHFAIKLFRASECVAHARHPEVSVKRILFLQQHPLYRLSVLRADGAVQLPRLHNTDTNSVTTRATARPGESPEPRSLAHTRIPALLLHADCSNCSWAKAAPSSSLLHKQKRRHTDRGTTRTRMTAVSLRRKPSSFSTVKAGSYLLGLSNTSPSMSTSTSSSMLLDKRKHTAERPRRVKTRSSCGHSAPSGRRNVTTASPPPAGLGGITSIYCTSVPVGSVYVCHLWKPYIYIFMSKSRQYTAQYNRYLLNSRD